MKVNKTIYIIVALILGGLGVHKFYADQVGQGILHLVFSGLAFQVLSQSFMYHCYFTKKQMNTAT